MVTRTGGVPHRGRPDQQPHRDQRPAGPDRPCRAGHRPVRHLERLGRRRRHGHPGPGRRCPGWRPRRTRWTAARTGPAPRWSAAPTRCPGSPPAPAGSTVPVKFALKTAAGTAVTAAAAPAWLTPVKGGPTSAPVDGTAPAATADSGSAYRADTTAGQYVYNWKTGTGGNYWRVGVGLDDGQTYSVTIGLR
ncbi:MAG TPA: PxKF domain-containing protein [Mycobacteriales bacterium]